MPTPSWRVEFDSTTSMHIIMRQAFPDSNSIYHVSLMHLGPGDELRISSDAMPYARYFR